MRVLMLYPWLPSPEAGHGSAAVVSALLTGLSRQTQLTLVCGFSPSESPQIEFVRNQVHQLIAVERPSVSGMSGASRCSEMGATAWKRLVHGWPLPALKQWRRSLRRALLAAAAQSKPDLLHLEIGSLAPYAALLPRCPSVLVDHEVQSTPQWRRFMQQHYGRCRELVALCRHDAQLLHALLQRDIHIRPVALPLHPPVARTPHSNRLLFVGSARHLPNQEALRFLLNSVLPTVRAVVPTATLRVVGSTAAEFGVAATAGVEFAGRVPELAQEFANAALVLAPVSSGGGVRIKNVEALQCGAPLLTTPLGWRGLEDLPASVGAVAEIPEFAARAVALLQDPQSLASMAQSARTHCARDDSTLAATNLTLNIWHRALSSR